MPSLQGMKWQELTSLPDEELIELYDRETPSVVLGLAYLHGEFVRRALERSGDRIERLTRYILWLTVANVLAAIVNVVILFAR